jgi:hypothetical protein
MFAHHFQHEACLGCADWHNPARILEIDRPGRHEHHPLNEPDAGIQEVSTEEEFPELDPDRQDDCQGATGKWIALRAAAGSRNLRDPCCREGVVPGDQRRQRKGQTEARQRERGHRRALLLSSRFLQQLLEAQHFLESYVHSSA